MATDLALAVEAVLTLSEKWTPVATDFRMEDFTGISFTHHMEIMHTVKGVAERLFYIQASARCHWSKYTLRERLKQDLYHHQGTLPNNFAATIPDDKQYMQAIQLFKDEYFLDFINTEELDLTDPQDMDDRIIPSRWALRPTERQMNCQKTIRFWRRLLKRLPSCRMQ